jgi:hypothetical protein
MGLRTLSHNLGTYSVTHAMKIYRLA